jgi:hypothetical protein
VQGNAGIAVAPDRSGQGEDALQEASQDAVTSLAAYSPARDVTTFDPPQLP